MLVLRALNLGDLLVGVPALRGLRSAYPAHRLVLATSPTLAPVVRLAGCVDELLPTADPAALRWADDPPAVVVNLHGIGPQSHRALDALAPGERIGFSAPGWDGPDWADVAGCHPHERERWCALLAAHGIPADPADLALPVPPRRMRRGPVLLHPGARYGCKRWPADRYAELAAALTRAGHLVLITGSAAERPLAETVAVGAKLPARRVLAGTTDLARLCELVALADLVISGDTGIAHLASAFGTPSVVLFGPVDPAQWGPPAAGPHVTLADPAMRRGDPFADEPDPALLAIEPADVLAGATAARALRHVVPAPEAARGVALLEW